MPREDGNDSPAAQRTLTDIWSMNLNPIRNAVAQLRTPAERAEVASGEPPAERAAQPREEARGGAHVAHTHEEAHAARSEAYAAQDSPRGAGRGALGAGRGGGARVEAMHAHSTTHTTHALRRAKRATVI